MTIETPLMWLDKAATWAMTEDLGGETLIELVIEHTHSCYPRRPRAPPSLGLGLRPVPVMRPATQGLRHLARQLKPRAVESARAGPGGRP
jgi:7-cyano-7-deazaguanine synthase